MTTLTQKCLAALAALAFAYSSFGDTPNEDVYLAPDVFVAESFDGAPPKPAVLWITKELKPEIQKILGHDYPALRVRYWSEGERSAWILEEIGKVKPITVGIVVESDKIVRLKVLIYRESHGWEVKHSFFTDQFKEAELTKKLRLNKNIDGISGATLSVNALERLGRLALFLDQCRAQ
ncbi:FMN-binding protein [Pelagicoccus sp. SDUM812002]|uniref:FMN-binding protein n=1 Tax=Pelagicoccus sp. SDUM812002 TaxID=3041266 RepID=UPI00280ECE5E|nr:FMN-binding protein [Pelagicoccus sp. SDUM812002]MDQ8186614.1 FMN-binding protein [Pelagicoccus sp. SDUM812002]